MSERQPKLGEKFESLLAVEVLHPNIGYGGIYDNTYTLFVSKDSRIEEILPTEFVDVIIKSLHRNYVSKSTLRGLLNTCLEKT
ncbi:MAG: hypothetical protein NC827_08220 [Candidatus Omnitrophica bacterium]|nr:hypothetical protein [Candidatus Omnitrophota bacterium]